jgi:hypothetical protein
VRVAVEWVARATPLAPSGVIARGAAAPALARRLLSHDLADLACVAGPGLLVLLGADLPWVDGVVYVGRDPAAPELLLPTALAPTVAPPLLAHAVKRTVDGSPIAVIPGLIVPCADARTIDRGLLAAWLEAAA